MRNGELVTPPVTASILESITRQFIIDISEEKLQLKVVERDINRTELYLADELFFVGTAMEIVPALSVDKYDISTTAGKTTRLIRDYYYQIVRNSIQSYYLTIMD